MPLGLFASGGAALASSGKTGDIISGIGSIISGGIGGLFGGSNFREGQTQCVPCGKDFKPAEKLFSAFQIDPTFQNELQLIVEDSLAREGVILTGGASGGDLDCNNLENPRDLALFIVFSAKGSRDCKQKGQSEKELARLLPGWLRRAEKIIKTNPLGGSTSTNKIQNTALGRPTVQAPVSSRSVSVRRPASATLDGTQGEQPQKGNSAPLLIVAAAILFFMLK